MMTSDNESSGVERTKPKRLWLFVACSLTLLSLFWSGWYLSSISPAFKFLQSAELMYVYESSPGTSCLVYSSSRPITELRSEAEKEVGEGRWAIKSYMGRSYTLKEATQTILSIDLYELHPDGRWWPPVKLLWQGPGAKTLIVIKRTPSSSDRFRTWLDRLRFKGL